MFDFFGILGAMTCIYVIFELIASYTRSHDKDSSGILFPILGVFMYLLMICSAPIGLLIRWHDSVMEKIHQKHFLEDYGKSLELSKRNEDYLQSEVKRLSKTIDDLKDQAFDDLMAAQERSEMYGKRSGYIAGFKDGFEDGIFFDEDDKENPSVWRLAAMRKSHLRADLYMKIRPEDYE